MILWAVNRVVVFYLYWAVNRVVVFYLYWAVNRVVVFYCTRYLQLYGHSQPRRAAGRPRRSILATRSIYKAGQCIEPCRPGRPVADHGWEVARRRRTASAARARRRDVSSELTEGLPRTKGKS